VNIIIIIGRLTRDPELRTTTSQIPIATFTVAVDRKFKNANGDREADFIQCVAWRQQGEFISKYFKKGSRIAVTGNLQTRNWEDSEGHKRTSTEVIVDSAEFVESKGTAKPQAAPQAEDEYALPFDI
jgi:single-strand DNA-binding protein